MKLVCLIIGAILFIGGLVLQIISMKKIVKDRSIKNFSKTEWIKVILPLLAIGVGLLLMLLSAFIAHPEWVEDRSKRLVLALVGGFFAGVGLSSFIYGMGFRYLDSALSKELKKGFSIAILVSIVPLLGGFLVFMEGFAPFLTYPLVSGITFKDGVLTFFRAGESTGSFHIAWYGLIIISGVVVVYFICDHAFYKKYKKHGILDNLVLIAFPAGIIGARIWYVVGNWQRMFAGRPFWNVFAIWDGGLTILGGAFLGIVAGVLFMRLRRRYVDIWFAVDVCVPTILIAQAIGRWGNFFNCEVYGQVVSTSSWSFLPTWIINQMCISNSGLALPANQMHVPLFLIESLINIAGYFIIAYGVGKGLKKWIVGGELAGAYFMFYGIVRIIMEPLRDGNFNMGSDGSWSVVNSLIYILLGIILIVSVHMNAYRKNKKAKKWIIPVVGGSSLILATLFFLLPSISVGIIHNSSSVSFAYSLSGIKAVFGTNFPIHTIAWVLGIIGAILLIVSPLKKKEGENLKHLILPIISFVLIFVATVIFFVGSKWNSLPIDPIIDYKYSLSYGFALFALFGLLALMMGGLTIYPELHQRHLQKKEAKKND